MTILKIPIAQPGVIQFSIPEGDIDEEDSELSRVLYDTSSPSRLVAGNERKLMGDVESD